MQQIIVNDNCKVVGKRRYPILFICIILPTPQLALYVIPRIIYIVEWFLAFYIMLRNFEKYKGFQRNQTINSNSALIF